MKVSAKLGADRAFDVDQRIGSPEAITGRSEREVDDHSARHPRDVVIHGVAVRETARRVLASVEHIVACAALQKVVSGASFEPVCGKHFQ